MSDWQPIDTAPKDGTAVLMFTGSRMRVCWLGQCGWTYYQKHGGPAVVALNPTHWMPLPAPPNVGGQK